MSWKHRWATSWSSRARSQARPAGEARSWPSRMRTAHRPTSSTGWPVTMTRRSTPARRPGSSGATLHGRHHGAICRKHRGRLCAYLCQDGFIRWLGQSSGTRDEGAVTGRPRACKLERQALGRSGGVDLARSSSSWARLAASSACLFRGSVIGPPSRPRASTPMASASASACASSRCTRSSIVAAPGEPCVSAGVFMSRDAAPRRPMRAGS